MVYYSAFLEVSDIINNNNDTTQILNVKLSI